jgi:hypothetical protein
MSARTLLLSASFALPVAALADQLNIKLGLWEIVSTTQVAGSPTMPTAMLDKMTPEQRAQVQAADASSGTQTETERECIMQDDIENPFNDDDTADCTHTIVSTTRTTQELRLTCTGDTPGSGLLRIDSPTPETLTGTLDLQIDHGAGLMTLQSHYEGRWLGADCIAEDDADDDEAAEDSARQ